MNHLNALQTNQINQADIGTGYREALANGGAQTIFPDRLDSVNVKDEVSSATDLELLEQKQRTSLELARIAAEELDRVTAQSKDNSRLLLQGSMSGASSLEDWRSISGYPFNKDAEGHTDC